jgi:hypothetical protein
MNMSAVGLGLLVVAAMNLFVGAAALLPTKDVAFRTSCVPLTAALAAIGLAALVFAAVG